MIDPMESNDDHLREIAIVMLASYLAEDDELVDFNLDELEASQLPDVLATLFLHHKPRMKSGFEALKRGWEARGEQ